MKAFTIFKDVENNKFTAVYDSCLPTQTGIGRFDCWKAVHHGTAENIFDMVKQRKEFEKENAGKA